MSIKIFLRQAVLPLLVLCLLVAPAAAAGILNAQEQAIADKLQGSARPFIVIDPVLTAVARNHARDMAEHHYFDHTNSQGYGPNYMVQKAGYVLPANYGTGTTTNYIESIAAGQSTASATWGDWMGSAPHKKHLMAEDNFYAQQTSVGVGYYADPSSDYLYYWVVISAPPQPTPALTVISPAAGTRVTTPQVAVTGRTGGTSTAASVQFRVENANGTGAYVNATGVTAWSGTATGLIPGPNVIRIRSLNGSGSTISETTRAVSYILYKPLTVSVSGQGNLTPGFAGTTQRAVGFNYTVRAVPAAGYMFSGWSGSSSSKSALLTFKMADGFTLTANFIPNPFIAKAGLYTGLLQNGAAGSLTANVTAMGIVSGRVTVNGTAYSILGRLAADGSGSVTLSNGARLNLNLNLATNGALSASLSGPVTASVSADPTYRAAVRGDYPRAGRYTVLLPPNPQSADASAPKGHGYGTLAIARNGYAVLTGALADGRTFSAATYVQGNDQIDFYTPVYVGGYLAGTVTVRDSGVSDLDGTLHWSKPAIPAARIHPAALEADLPAIGSRYVPPAAGQPVFDLNAATNNSAITLANGDLTQPITQTCTLDVANHLTPARAPMSSLRAAVNPVTGLFGGSFTHPVSNQLTAFRGVIFQKQNAGYGYFLGVDESGSASLSPMP